MFEKETIKHIVVYLKVKIAEAELKKSDSLYPESAEVLESLRDACACLGAFKDVLNELEEFYGQELE